MKGPRFTRAIYYLHNRRTHLSATPLLHDTYRVLALARTTRNRGRNDSNRQREMTSSHLPIALIMAKGKGIDEGKKCLLFRLPTVTLPLQPTRQAPCICMLRGIYLEVGCIPHLTSIFFSVTHTASDSPWTMRAKGFHSIIKFTPEGCSIRCKQGVVPYRYISIA